MSHRISRSQLIQLSNDKPFASGGHRDCFRHPDGSNRCIKVLHEPWKEIDRRKKDPLRHVRRRRNYDENRQEWFELRKLERKLNSKVALHFPKQYGFVKTDLGEGLVVDLIIDADAKPSLTLKTYLWEYGLNPSCQSAIDAFWKFLTDHKVTVRDPFPHNLLVRRGDEGSLRIFQVDGFGSSDFLPFSRLIPYLRRRKLLGRRQRMERQIQKHLLDIASGVSAKGKGIVVRT